MLQLSHHQFVILTGIAGIVAFAMGRPSGSRPSPLLIIIIGLSLAVCIVTVNTFLIRRLARQLTSLESRINAIAGESLLQWETMAAQQTINSVADRAARLLTMAFRRTLNALRR